MVFQNPFKVEQYMDEHETNITYNLGETCCHSLSLKDIEQLSGNPPPLDKIDSIRLTYGAIRGTDDLKNGISSLYDNIGLDDIVVTNGAIGANFLTIYSLIDSTDHVIVVDPTYEQLKSVPTIFKGEVSLLPLKSEEGWIPSVDTLKSLIKPNTKLIIINNPNNPSGQYIQTSILEKIVNVAKENDAYLLCDEVYRPLFHGVSKPKSIVELYEKGISTGSCSKAFSAAGIRLGWIASKDKDFINACFLRRDYNTISISMIDDIIGTYILLNKDAILKRNHELCAQNIKIIEDFVHRNSTKVSWVKPNSGATCFIKLHTVENTYDFCSNLAVQHSTLIVPGEVFDHPGYIRIGFGNSSKELVEGLKILEALI
ncbi:hypothetical protein WICANDRAFT_28570 [Wickerhamomyces anomalus NRRL Y-366-8]|uniref:Aminotransferase class I/classII large domain-containing protein n=1 Tax=Wickerhamomyces anomalus (strain ATCC 58044 / CBS 1984 / NCYC 433 / NRRL Y-366-8) TaxID=683960 RepID=A0A1E3P5N9_WICAA|nr:uncharacterized protein WICANDRAFT_28570 [Wickerhamomyces anomalus NRRL Y-366-8]ODQ60761.1 hypothetical protein WICANDRAFT_28570 [Wickerhamomyces anomalus NRRL Y-366-8]